MIRVIITRNFGVAGMHGIQVATRNGAYGSLSKLFDMAPGGVIGEAQASGLRGRGGAGFPVGDKWAFVPKSSKKPVYLIVNADESEPGTFKDRAILERDPHLVIEGAIIAAYAIGARCIFAYFRGEYFNQWRRFIGAVDEARKAGFIGENICGSGFSCDIIVHRGAGAYICGEETALIKSLEGKRGLPSIKPPFPASSGLYGCPTIINNVETLSSLPFIVREGAQAFRAIGTRESPGTKLISVCGHVENPGVYEVEMGMPVSTFLATLAGGTLGGRKLKALIPGGTSAPVLTSEEALGARLDFESMKEAGSMLGSGGMIAIDESGCCVRFLADVARFYSHESCGQCAPCREGTECIRRIVEKIEAGGAEPLDLDLLVDVATGMKGVSVCPLGDSLVLPVMSFVSKFRSEFEEHIRLGRCPFP